MIDMAKARERTPNLETMPVAGVHEFVLESFKAFGSDAKSGADVLADLFEMNIPNLDDPVAMDGQYGLRPKGWAMDRLQIAESLRNFASGKGELSESGQIALLDAMGTVVWDEGAEAEQTAYGVERIKAMKALAESWGKGHGYNIGTIPVNQLLGLENSLATQTREVEVENVNPAEVWRLLRANIANKVTDTLDTVGGALVSAIRHPRRSLTNVALVLILTACGAGNKATPTESPTAEPTKNPVTLTVVAPTMAGGLETPSPVVIGTPTGEKPTFTPVVRPWNPPTREQWTNDFEAVPAGTHGKFETYLTNLGWDKTAITEWLGYYDALDREPLVATIDFDCAISETQCFLFGKDKDGNYLWPQGGALAAEFPYYYNSETAKEYGKLAPIEGSSDAKSVIVDEKPILVRGTGVDRDGYETFASYWSPFTATWESNTLLAEVTATPEAGEVVVTIDNMEQFDSAWYDEEGKVVEVSDLYGEGSATITIEQVKQLDEGQELVYHELETLDQNPGTVGSYKNDYLLLKNLTLEQASLIKIDLADNTRVGDGYWSVFRMGTLINGQHTSFSIFVTGNPFTGVSTEDIFEDWQAGDPVQRLIVGYLPGGGLTLEYMESQIENQPSSLGQYRLYNLVDVFEAINRRSLMQMISSGEVLMKDEVFVLSMDH